MLTLAERRTIDKFTPSLVFPHITLLRAYVELIIERRLTEEEWLDFRRDYLGHNI